MCVCVCVCIGNNNKQLEHGYDKLSILLSILTTTVATYLITWRLFTTQVSSPQVFMLVSSWPNIIPSLVRIHTQACILWDEWEILVSSGCWIRCYEVLGTSSSIAVKPCTAKLYTRKTHTHTLLMYISAHYCCRFGFHRKKTWKIQLRR